MSENEKIVNGDDGTKGRLRTVQEKLFQNGYTCMRACVCDYDKWRVIFNDMKGNNCNDSRIDVESTSYVWALRESRPGQRRNYYIIEEIYTFCVLVSE